MDRELSTERRASPTSSGDKPKVFVITGSPNMGKVDLAMDIINLVDNLAFVDVPPAPYYALGSLADYRAELFHALQRYFVTMEHFKKGEDQICVHSLIDSFAWAIYNTQRKILNDISGTYDTEALGSLFLGQILFDSFAADHIFVPEGWSDNDDMVFYERLMAVVNNLDVPRTILYEEDKDKWPEICAKVIGEVRGQRRDNR